MRRLAQAWSGAVSASLTAMAILVLAVLPLVRPLPCRAGALEDMESNLAGDDIASGVAARARGDINGAIARYTAAIKSNALDNENLAVAHNNRGNAYDDKGDSAQAMQDYDQAIKLNPSFAEAYYNRALLRHRLGRDQEALRDYNHLLTLNPYLASGYFNRSFTWAALGQYDQAVADVEKALELSPGNAKYQAQLRDWKAARTSPPKPSR